jgi:hypothetical protein
MKTQRQSLESARQALYKRKVSSSMVITSAVANATALFKSHMPDLDVEILRKDFAIDERERKELANGAYDTTHDFVSLHDLSRLAESDDNSNPWAL